MDPSVNSRAVFHFRKRPRYRVTGDPNFETEACVCFYRYRRDETTFPLFLYISCDGQSARASLFDNILFLFLLFPFSIFSLYFVLLYDVEKASNFLTTFTYGILSLGNGRSTFREMESWFFVYCFFKIGEDRSSF